MALLAGACNSDPGSAAEKALSRAMGGERYAYPPPGGQPATCDGAAVQMVRLLAAEHGDQAVSADARFGFVRLCHDERWSDACLRCIVEAATFRDVAGRCETGCRP